MQIDDSFEWRVVAQALLNLLNSSLETIVHIIHELDRKPMYILLIIAFYNYWACSVTAFRLTFWVSSSPVEQWSVLVGL